MQQRSRIRVDTGPKAMRKIGKMIDRRMNAKHETKEKSITRTGVGITATFGLVESITTLVDGTKNGERIGLEVFPTLIEFDYEWIVDVTDVTNICRTTVIHWKDDDAVNDPDISKIYEDVAFVRPLSAFKYANKGEAREFTVLYDRYHSLNIHGKDSVVGKVKLYGRRLPNVINFNDSTTSAGKGKVYLVLWSDSTLSGPRFKMNGVFKYKN